MIISPAAVTWPDAYDSASPRGSLTYTRVYLLTGHCAHLRPDDGGDVLCEAGQVPCCATKPCCCGLHASAARYDDPPDPRCSCPHEQRHDRDDWLGTGCQAEYDKAGRLPLCRGCFAVRERLVPDERLGTGHGRAGAGGERP